MFFRRSVSSLHTCFRCYHNVCINCKYESNKSLYLLWFVIDVCVLHAFYSDQTSPASSV